jgi:hypothetical protein
MLQLLLLVEAVIAAVPRALLLLSTVMRVGKPWLLNRLAELDTDCSLTSCCAAAEANNGDLLTIVCMPA